MPVAFLFSISTPKSVSSPDWTKGLTEILKVRFSAEKVLEPVPNLKAAKPSAPTKMISENIKNFLNAEIPVRRAWLGLLSSPELDHAVGTPKENLDRGRYLRRLKRLSSRL